MPWRRKPASVSPNAESCAKGSPGVRKELHGSDGDAGLEIECPAARIVGRPVPRWQRSCLACPASWLKHFGRRRLQRVQRACQRTSGHNPQAHAGRPKSKKRKVSTSGFALLNRPNDYFMLPCGTAVTIGSARERHWLDLIPPDQCPSQLFTGTIEMERSAG
jgi:hypothetical protein